jgi:DNA-binding CsgD family transcriptional regulator
MQPTDPPAVESDLGTEERRLRALELAAARPDDVRPCPSCVAPCGCPRRSPSCACGCVASCAGAAARLVPPGAAAEPGALPLALELARLRQLAPHWACEGHAAPSHPRGGPRPEVWFRSTSLLHVELVAAEIDARRDSLALRGTWAVTVRGAGGFVLAPQAVTAELPALQEEARRLAAGLATAVRARAARLAPVVRDDGRPAAARQGLAALSAREREVLARFLEGLGVAAIAAGLCISPYTVRNHLKGVFAKLGVSSQRQLRERFAPRSAEPEPGGPLP